MTDLSLKSELDPAKILTASKAAFVELSIATVATGTPFGICMVRILISGMPIHNKSKYMEVSILHHVSQPSFSDNYIE